MNIKVGEQSSFTKTITEADIAFFAAHSGDFHPLHMNEEFAKQYRFKGRVAHGILIGGLISTALSKIPASAGYVSQTLYFKKPVYIGDTVTVQCEVTEINTQKHRAKLNTVGRNQLGEVVIEGEAQILISELKRTSNLVREKPEGLLQPD